MRYLECRTSATGFGTYTRQQIHTGLYDFYIVYDDFDIKGLEVEKIIYLNDFVENKIHNIQEEDIFVFTCNDMSGFVGAYEMNCKKVLTLHDLTPIRIKERSRKYRDNWYKNVSEAVKRADYIVTVSNFSKEDIEKEFGKNLKVTVVYNYAQCTEEDFDAEDAEAFFKEKDLKRYKYIISCPGHVSKNKNFYKVIKAWKKTDLFNDSVLIATSRKRTIKFTLFLFLLRVHKRVIVPGYVSVKRLASLYYLSDFFVFATLREGFGLPALEALKMGTPVIASDSSCMQEILGDEMVVYVDPYKTDSIADGIKKISLLNKEDKNLYIEKYNKRKYINDMQTFFAEIENE